MENGTVHVSIFLKTQFGLSKSTTVYRIVILKQNVDAGMMEYG